MTMPRRTPVEFRIARCAWPLLIAVLLAACPAAADPEPDGEEPEAGGVQASYLRIAMAWVEGDPEALAELVHPDGLQVRIGSGGRATSYSPNQAFYFFKNLFRANSTESFDYQRQQQATGPRVHAMAVWHYREAAGDPLRERRLVLLLARAGDAWLLAEINAVR